MRKTFQEIEAEVMVLFALCAQALSVQRDRTNELDGLGVEPPLIGWNQPRPSQYITLLEGLDRDRASIGGVHFKRDPSMANDEELFGLFSFVEQIMTTFEPYI